MQPNDVALVRVYTKEPGEIISDVTFEVDSDIEVVLEAEAGSAIFGSGASYKFSFVIRDLSECVCIYEDELSGFFGDDNWPELRTQIVRTVPPRGIQDVINNIMQVEAVLLTGGVGPKGAPDASFATSPRFIVYTR